MKNTLFLLLMALYLTAHTQNTSTFFTEEASAAFVSDAPLELIQASTSAMKVAIDTSKQTVLFVIENFSFKGFNSPLQQEHFHENYMESKKYPRSVFSGKIIETINWINGTEQTVRAKGELDIHGVKTERIIKGILRFSADEISISASFNVLLEDHHIRTPKVVSRKISPEINVEVKAVLKPARSIKTN